MSKKSVAMTSKERDHSGPIGIKREYGLALKHLDEASALGFKVHPQLVELRRPYR